MQHIWLNKKNNKNLIVFFNGWGSIPAPDLKFEDFDVLLFQDWRSFEPIDIDFSAYEKKYLAAWSLGVYACNFYYETFKDFDGFTALNGTLKPIDDKYGIPETAYHLTINNFNEKTCRKFMIKTGAPEIKIERSIEDLKEELISVKNLKPDKFLPFGKVFLSLNDRIFPFNNMLSFWQAQNTLIIEKEAPHYIFGCFESWSSLI